MTGFYPDASAPASGCLGAWRTSLIHRGVRRGMLARRGMGSVGRASTASVSGGTAMALRRALAGLLAAPALVLAGCGGDSSVADPPVQSSPTSSPTSDPPAHETAEHFIRRWAEAEKQMENTGKTADYVALSRRCRGLRQTRRRGQRRSTRAAATFRLEGLAVRLGSGIRSSVRHDVFAIVNVLAPTTYQRTPRRPVRALRGRSSALPDWTGQPHGGLAVISFVAGRHRECATC